MNYSTNKVRVSYMITYPCTSQFTHSSYVWGATIKFPWRHEFPDLSLTLGLFPDFSLTVAEFPDISRKSRKVVTLYTILIPQHSSRFFITTVFWTTAGSDLVATPLAIQVLLQTWLQLIKLFYILKWSSASQQGLDPIKLAYDKPLCHQSW